MALGREVRQLVSKTAKTLDLMATELATTRQDNALLNTELGKYRADKRQTVTFDANQTFASLPDIRSAQNKLNKRLRAMPQDDQVPIDSFLEMQPSTVKRRRK